MKPIVIRGGRIIDPAAGRDETADLVLADGRVAGVGKNQGTPDGAEVIDAAGCVVAPGFVDLHVHLREPGREDVETIETGARAAVAGGFTSVCAMPNTDPVTDNQAAVGFIMAQARRARTARVYPIGAVSLGSRGEQMSEFGELVGAGAVAVSDDGKPVATAHLMRAALEYAKTFGIPVVDHCEDHSLSAGGAMHEGLTSTRLGITGIPRSAEDVIVARDILLAELTGGHVHLAHCSTAGSVRMVRDAKARGLRVTAEVTPHHLALTDAACEGYNTNAKMNPPLRESPDVAALREALVDGTVDCIATDHAPHHYDAKEAAFDDAPFGVVGLETALGIALTELVRPGMLALPALVDLLSRRPARVFNLAAGTLARGAAADVVVFDPAATWTVDPEAFFSKSRNTPFAGRELTGCVRCTAVGGTIVHRMGDRPAPHAVGARR
ncbi:MAG: dihydroorotase [Gemmatimonadetes bacterium GWC2_71_10]|nr:MAG: dihydroorotase [Gemmatimonadetes bacterium GWC2_71_10]